MLINGCILYPEQYKFIMRTAFLLLGTSIYGIKQGHYAMAIIPGSVFITSVNYWRKPDYSWRRTVDIYLVKGSMLYQTFRAVGTENEKIYYIIVILGTIFYLYGIHLYNKKRYWASTYSHSMLHVMGNLACIVLYSGNIPEIGSNMFYKRLTNY